MILNKSQREVAEKTRYESEASPVARAVCEAAEASADAFEVETAASGLEIRSRASVERGLPGRARLRVISPKPGHVLVFFYKKSLLPYSRDRYSYGGIDLKNPQVGPTEVTQWLAFLTSGFHPDKRPIKLRRAFPFEIPE